eukprot:3057219-Alexandrium_andersonii.AAC.1
MAPFDRGSHAGGDPSTVCTLNRSATARRKSTSAGSSSVLSKTPRRCPSQQMLATARTAASSRNRPSRNTGLSLIHI